MTDSSTIRGTLTLRPGRIKPFVYRHPWVFDGAVRRVTGDVPPGGIVRVEAPDGEFIGMAFYNPHGPLVAKLFHWTDDVAAFDAGFVAQRIRHAAARPERVAIARTTDALRLVFAESDGLPGLVVDRYGEWIVAELTSLAMVARRDLLADALAEALPEYRLLIRTDPAMAREEGFEPFDPEAVGGPPPEGPVTIDDDGLRFEVDLLHGHKTGFYLDQRANRRRLRAHADGARVLDIFCYTGGFALAAACGGAASVTGIDNSMPALEMAERNARLNGYENVEWVKGKANAVLRGFADEGRRYDVAVLDPPRLAPGRRSLGRALKAYTNYNRQAIEVLEPGGLLVTCSCSGAVTLEELIGAVNRGAVAAGRTAHVTSVGLQDADHPVAAHLPESLYLKALFVRVE